ncbi:unnamed protein product, partial [Ilex paraguariensis]
GVDVDMASRGAEAPTIGGAHMTDNRSPCWGVEEENTEVPREKGAKAEAPRE